MWSKIAVMMYEMLLTALSCWKQVISLSATSVEPGQQSDQALHCWLANFKF